MAKDKNKKNTATIKSITIGLLAAVLLAAVAFAAAWFYTGGDPTAWIVSIFGGKEDSVQTDEIKPGKIKIYSPQAKASDGAKLNSSFAALYDGDTATIAGGSSTLDAGAEKTLAYIRYMPDTSSEDAANACIGTRFLASNDNVNFDELAVAMPDANGNINPDWHTIEFSGFGSYRYFRIESAGSSALSEVEWVINTDMTLDDKDKLSAKFTAFDATESFSGETVIAVYSREQILKAFKVSKSDYAPGQYYDIPFDDITLEIGDYINIDVFDETSGTSALSAPLTYRYTGASPFLSMANVYSDNMLLQADEDLVISGSAPLGETINGYIENVDTGEVFAASAECGRDGWSLNFGGFENGGNYTMRIEDGSDTLEYENITFGDVWLLAGQSNMDFYMNAEKESADMLLTSAGKERSDNSGIRIVNMYNIGTQGAAAPIEDVPLNDWNEYWAPLTADRASYFSSIGYYFALGINERYGRNVGIISSAVGDTEINLWYPSSESNGTFTGTDGALYNNRVYPFTALKIKGILWYQGEADQYRTNMDSQQYADAMAGLINSYREKWNDPDLPFYYVQLVRYEPKDESEIREGQRLALQRVRSANNLGMISLLDVIGNYDADEIGNARNDIHPWQKELVANRFLDYVGHDIYDDEQRSTTGPRYKSMEIVGDTIELTFEHTGYLRIMDPESYADSVTDDNIDKDPESAQELQEFWLCGADNVYYPATADIIDDKVVLHSDDVPQPINAMYAWGAYPNMPNLTDDTGLPAYTFCTDEGSEFE